MSREFAGMSLTPGGVQKVCAKKVRAHFSVPRKGSLKNKFWGRIFHGRPRGYPGERRGAKTTVRPVSSQKGPTKPKNRTSSTKEFSEQFEGVTGHCPVNTGFEANHPNVRQNLWHTVSFGVPFLSPKSAHENH